MIKLIKESFSSTLPDWMKDGIKKLSKYDVNKVAWDTCEFEERPIPKGRAAASKNPNEIPVYLIKAYGDGGDHAPELAIPDLNINPIVLYKRINSGYRRAYNFNDKVAYSAIDVINFGVLRITDKTNDKRDNREASKSGVVQRYKDVEKADSYSGDKKGMEFGDSINSKRYVYKFDKSGYEITNPDRYAKILKDNAGIRKGNQYAKQLENMYNKMIKMRQTIKDLVNKDDASDDFIDDVSYMFSRCISKYRSSMRQTQEILKYAQEGRPFEYEERWFNNYTSEFEKAYQKLEDMVK